MAKKYRGNSIKRENMIEMYGVSDLLKKLEKAGGNVEQAVKKCVENSLQQVGMKMQLFMMEHRDTGDTYESFDMKPVEINDGTVTSIIGYQVKKGGLPAIFLDVGTPTRKGHFFRYYAVENSRKQIEQIQRATLEEILGDLI